MVEECCGFRVSVLRFVSGFGSGSVLWVSGFMVVGLWVEGLWVSGFRVSGFEV